MSRWFRHYAGMMRDEKLVRVAVRAKQPVERVVWVWGAILESAAEINEDGRYELDIGEAAYFLRCDEGDLGAVVDSLEHIGRLHEGVVAKWGDRQFSSDGAAERQRLYRERVKGRGGNTGKRDSDVQSGTRDVTRDVTPSSRDGEVTPQETETEKERTVASATDAASPVDVRKELWNEGVLSLKAMTGKTDGAARSLIGKWLAAAKDDCAVVLGKIRTARDDRMVDAVAWITAALKPPDPPPKKLTQGESLRNMARAAGVIDGTGIPTRHLEIGDRNREDSGFGDVVRLALAGNDSWRSG